ncbi:hypothetical protein ANCCEY_06362 [Ancylostoma ceylanicum]|uniref:Uncharacterized protein n=1 Tax=Ancylostoma ceylanicum TaxID=53326 RepID=A0A0D6LR68_9BILA|nr:hypothetical protein ANCCEY_06362 [Ancylostoma ceylanicum]
MTRTTYRVKGFWIMHKAVLELGLDPIAFVPDARPPHARSPLHVPQQVAKGWILSGENLEERRPREDLRLQFRRLLQLLLLARQSTVRPKI